MGNRIIAATLTIEVILSSGCAPGPSEKYTGTVEGLTVGVYKGEDASLVYLAKDEGFFTDNDLVVTIKEYAAGKYATKDLIEKKVDISTTSSTAFMFKVFNHPDLRILSTIAETDIMRLVARKDKGISELSDLKGRRIGVKKATGSEFFAYTFLLYSGISSDEVEFVDIKPSEVVDIITNGELDAAMTWAPQAFELKERLGENLLVWSGTSGVKQLHYFMAVSREDVIRSKPEAIRRFIKALVEAEEFAKEYPEEAKKNMRIILDRGQAFIDNVWSCFNFAVRIPQSLLILLEDQTRWAMEHRLTDEKKVPDYLDYIYMDALEEVKPEAISIIR